MSQEKVEEKVEVKQIPVPTVEKLLEDILKGQKISVAFSNKFLEGYKIGGKTLLEWREYFKIEIPIDLDSNQCKMVDVQLLSKMDEAFYYQMYSEAVLTALVNGQDQDKATRFEILKHNYRATRGKEPPASALPELRKEADRNGTTLGTTVANAKIERDFFSSIIKHLGECRRIVEGASISNGTIAKLSQSAY